MMMIKSLLFTLSFFVVTQTQAAPAARIEPYIGFKSAALTSQAELGGVGVSMDRAFAGGITGFRLSGSFTDAFNVGIEFAYGYLEQRGDRLLTRDAGIFIQHDFQIPLRTWLTYYFASEIRSDNLGGPTAGDGTKFGIGYMGFKPVSLNIEYLALAYKANSTGAPGIEPSVGSILISISSPIDL